MFVNERAVRTFERYKRNIRAIFTFVAFPVLLLRLHALTCVDLRLHTFIANDLRLLRLPRMGSKFVRLIALTFTCVTPCAF